MIRQTVIIRLRTSLPSSGRKRRFFRSGFTLLELMVVISVMGLLLALLLPAVQQARESARIMQCRSNLHQIGVALHHFESQHRSFPVGNDFANGSNHSWCTWLLPSLGQAELFQKYDFQKPWNDPAGNLSVVSTNLRTLVCPSGTFRRPGGGDYGGCMGSTKTGLAPGLSIGQGWEAGALISTNIGGPSSRTEPTRAGEFTDGMSQTFAILESADRKSIGGFWGIGFNCVGFEYEINSRDNLSEGETLDSPHVHGGSVLFADGHVAFLSNSSDLKTLARLSTRAGTEVVDTSW